MQSNVSAELSQSMISFSVDQAILTLRIVTDGRTYLDYQIDTSKLNSSMIWYILLCASHGFLYNVLPSNIISIEFSDDINDPDLKNIISNLAQLYRGTNEILHNLHATKSKTADYNRTLIYNVDDSPWLKKIFEHKTENVHAPIFYKTFYTGFNTFTRQAGEPSELFTPSDMLAYIHENQICRVISLNMYYLEYMSSRHSVFMLAVFKKLGISYNIIDWDIHGITGDVGIIKAAYNCQSFVRYVAFPGYEAEWDKLMGLSNIAYYPVNLVENRKVDFCRLHDDYKILCVTHSRIKSLIPGKMLENILAAFEFTRDDNLFYDSQFWFHAMNFYLVRRDDINLVDRLMLRKYLLDIHFDGMSVLKYEVLEQLSTDREVILYGDEMWGKLFPQYYQNEYLSDDQRTTLLKSRDYLYLQFNSVLSYPESHPVVSYAITSSVPFIGFPAVVKTPELQGFHAVEYSNTSDLNRLIADVNSTFQQPELIGAMNSYVDRMSMCNALFCQALKTNNQQLTANYTNYCREHRAILESKIEDYIRINSDKLDSFLRYLAGESTFEINQSRFYKRNYIQNILQLRQEIR